MLKINITSILRGEMQMGNNLIITLLCFGTGLFTIVSSILNFDFFFENRKARLFVAILGRNGARVFYSLLGIFIIALSFKI